MRQIDSEPLGKEIRRLKEKVSTFGHQDYRCGYISAMSTVEGMIASAPAIDAEPVRHGRWKKDAHCSICERFCTLAYIDDEELPLYCPNCGAKMDEEVQHAEKRSDP